MMITALGRKKQAALIENRAHGCRGPPKQPEQLSCIAHVFSLRPNPTRVVLSDFRRHSMRSGGTVLDVYTAADRVCEEPI